MWGCHFFRFWGGGRVAVTRAFLEINRAGKRNGRGQLKGQTGWEWQRRREGISGVVLGLRLVSLCDWWLSLEPSGLRNRLLDRKCMGCQITGCKIEDIGLERIKSSSWCVAAMVSACVQISIWRMNPVEARFLVFPLYMVFLLLYIRSNVHSIGKSNVCLEHV